MKGRERGCYGEILEPVREPTLFEAGRGETPRRGKEASKAMDVRCRRKSRNVRGAFGSKPDDL